MQEPPQPDRITRAGELRAAIHAWLRATPDATMNDIIAAFPRHKPDSLRKTIKRMRQIGSVFMSGKHGQTNCTYRAVGESTSSARDARRRLAECGAANVNAATPAATTKRMRDAQQKRDQIAAAKAAEAAKKAAEPAKPKYTGQVAGGRTVYNSGDDPEIRKHQRGQGAVRGRVFVNCYQLY